MSASSSRVWAGALAADLLAVLTFAAAGRQSHEEGSSILLVLVIAWPFAVAAGLAYAGLRALGADPRSWRGGLVAVGTTYAIGMVLRGLSGRGLDPAFLVVALISLAVLMLGWRAVLRLLGRRQARPRARRRSGSIRP